MAQVKLLNCMGVVTLEASVICRVISLDGSQARILPIDLEVYAICSAKEKAQR